MILDECMKEVTNVMGLKGESLELMQMGVQLELWKLKRSREFKRDECLWLKE